LNRNMRYARRCGERTTDEQRGFAVTKRRQLTHMLEVLRMLLRGERGVVGSRAGKEVHMWNATGRQGGRGPCQKAAARQDRATRQARPGRPAVRRISRSIKYRYRHGGSSAGALDRSGSGWPRWAGVRFPDGRRQTRAATPHSHVSSANGFSEQGQTEGYE